MLSVRASSACTSSSSTSGRQLDATFAVARPCASSSAIHHSSWQQQQSADTRRRRSPATALNATSAPAPGKLPSPLSSTDTKEPTVEEVMVPHPVVFTESTPIKEAVRVMLEKDISGAPVVDDSGRLLGVLSESDVIWKGAGAPQDHFLIPPVYISIVDAFIFLRDNKQFEDEVHKILSKTVGESMTRDVVSVAPSDPMSKAAQVMLQKKVNRLPVVEDGKVVGVITRHDVLRGIYASQSPFL